MKLRYFLDIYLNPLLLTLATFSFIYLAIPISNGYKSKNKCIKYASKQLVQNLPETYINESKFVRESN